MPRSEYGVSAPTAQPVRGRTYCQIAGKEIAANVCLATQGQEGCFGCASVLRRCETCKVQRVDVPAVGMCSWCLVEALEDARHAVRPNLKFGTRVDCQIHKRLISVPMCNAIQGKPECAGCPAPSRLCEKCTQRRARYSRYGLCLICTVEAYGDGWQPPARERPIPPTTVVREPEHGVVRLVVPRIDRHAQPAQPHTRTPSIAEVKQHMTPRSLETTPPKQAEPAWEPPPNIPRDRRDRSFTQVVAEAETLVTKTRRASALYLSRELHIDQARKAPAVLLELEARGIIGPPQGPRKVREVLVPPPSARHTGAAACTQQNPDGSVCGKPVWIKRLSLCVTHGHAFYRHQRQAQAGKSQSDADPMAMMLLRAKQFILSERRATGRSLARHLKVDFQMAKRVVERLRHEGFLGKRLGLKTGWEILGTSVTGKTTALVPWSSSRILQDAILKVEALVGLVGEKSEMAIALRTLIDEVRRAESARKALEH